MKIYIPPSNVLNVWNPANPASPLNMDIDGDVIVGNYFIATLLIIKLALALALMVFLIKEWRK